MSAKKPSVCWRRLPARIKSYHNILYMITVSESSGKTRNIKKRYWSFILYPESAPADWLEQLERRGLSGAISPLHDKDVLPTGEPKKAHYHVMLVYQRGSTTYNAVKHITDDLGQPRPIPVESEDGMYDYLTHLNRPDKYQYDPADIRTFGGYKKKVDADNTIAELTRYIRESGIREYADLIYRLLDDGRMSDFSVARSNTYYFSHLLASVRNGTDWGKSSRGQVVHRETDSDIDALVDTNTGEIIEERSHGK